MRNIGDKKESCIKDNKHYNMDYTPVGIEPWFYSRE